MDATIDALRADALASRHQELRNINSSRKRKLQELYSVTLYYEGLSEFPSLDVVKQWEELDGGISNDAERKFLENSDIEKGLLFNELSLPSHTVPYSGHPPEPGGQASRTILPAKTPQRLAPVAPKPIRIPTPPVQVATPPSAPDSIQKISALRSPPQLRNTVTPPPTATLEVRTNGRHSEGEPSRVEEETPAPKFRQSPETPSASPLSETGSPLIGAQKDEAAPVVNVGGVPAIQEISTAIPTEEEKAKGVHPPPPPPDMESDMTMEDVKPGVTPAEESLPTPQAPSPKPTRGSNRIRSKVPSPKVSRGSKAATPRTLATPPAPAPLTPQQSTVIEIPDSDDSLSSPPPSSAPAAPLAIITEQHRLAPVPDPTNPLQLPEASSPASTTDNDAPTPYNNISSATSPDPHHLQDLKSMDIDNQEMENHSKPIGVSIAKKMETQPALHCGPVVCNALPSATVAEEVAKKENEIDIPLPTLPSDELPNGSSIKAEEERKEQEIHVISSPVMGPRSPDPSAQLQLENQLANAEALSPTKELPPEPQQVQTPVIPSADATAPGSPDSAVESESEDEDRVQLVESDEASSPVGSPKREIELPEVVQQRARTQTGDVTGDVINIQQNTPTAINLIKDEVKVQQTTPVPAAIPGTAPQTVTEQQPKPEKIEVPQHESQLPKTTMVENSSHVERVVDSGIHVGNDDTDTDVEQIVKQKTVSKSIPQSPKEIESVSIPVVKDSEDEDEEGDSIMHDAEPTPQITKKTTNVPVAHDTPKVFTVAPRPVEEHSMLPPHPKSPTAIPEDPEDVEIDSITVPEDPRMDIEDIGMATAPSTPEPEAAEPATEQNAEPAMPALFARHLRKKSEPVPPKLHKVVISSAYHAAAAAEAEAKRSLEEQESQGLIVVARRRTQQAASASRGRPSVFAPGSKMEALTRYTVEDDAPKEMKTRDYSDSLYTVKSMPTSVSELLLKSSKTITTADFNLASNDKTACKVISRVQDLQDHGVWSMRQIAKAEEPRRRKCHWDYLLEEMKWLRTDFKEERKLKIAQCRQIAYMVKDWRTAPVDQRSKLQVDRKKFGRVPKGIRQMHQKRKSVSNGMDYAMDHPTPELIAGGDTPEDEGTGDYFGKKDAQDDVVMDLGDGIYAPPAAYDHINEPPPAAIFSLKPEETVFYMPRTKATEELLEQLPLFGPPQPPERPEYFENSKANSIIATSKYVNGRIKFPSEDRPRIKRTRYDYEHNWELYADDSDEDGVVVNAGYDAHGRPVSRDKTSKPIPLHPEQNNVALFRPEFKPTLQRIRNHAFRPPLEQPPVGYFQSRNPSLWTPEEDERLRQLVKEYNYNWQFVEAYMKIDGEFHSGAERRSQWECFERWMSIENPPQEFLKAPFYKGVQQRLEIAQTESDRFINLANSGGQVPALKRRGTTPAKVDRRRVSRQYTQFDAIRKLAKKRETNMIKHGGNRGNVANLMRKQGTSTGQTRTPQYFSALKQKRDEEAKLLAAQRVPGMSGAVPNAARLPSGVPAPRVATPIGGPPRPNAPYPAMAPMRGAQPQMRPLNQLEMQQYAMRQQQINQLARAQQQAATRTPTQAEILKTVMTQNPQLSQAEATLHAQTQLAMYHAHVGAAISAQANRRPPTAVARSTGTGGTGVLIGANGPIGPGAAQHQAQQQSRQGTPVGIAMGQSPRLGQVGVAGSPRISQQGVVGMQSPQMGVPRVAGVVGVPQVPGVQVGQVPVGLGLQMGGQGMSPTAMSPVSMSPTPAAAQPVQQAQMLQAPTSAPQQVLQVQQVPQQVAVPQGVQK